jgi:hypothetical protein
MGIGEVVSAGTPDELIRSPYTTAITIAPRGGWLVIVSFREGISLSRWFRDEEHARGYPDELDRWLDERVKLM